MQQLKQLDNLIGSNYLFIQKLDLHQTEPNSTFNFTLFYISFFHFIA